jgi:uncharacterized protein YggU (UPF0235/DUF167 family)
LIAVPIRAESDGLCVDILAQPRAARARIGPLRGDRIKVAVTSPPAVEALLA